MNLTKNEARHINTFGKNHHFIGTHRGPYVDKYKLTAMSLNNHFSLMDLTKEDLEDIQVGLSKEFEENERRLKNATGKDSDTNLDVVKGLASRKKRLQKMLNMIEIELKNEGQ